MSVLIKAIQHPAVRRVATEIARAAASKAIDLAADALKNR